MVEDARYHVTSRRVNRLLVVECLKPVYVLVDLGVILDERVRPRDVCLG